MVQEIQIKKKTHIQEERKGIPIKTILNQIMKRVTNQEEVKAVLIKTIHNQIIQIIMIITKKYPRSFIPKIKKQVKKEIKKQIKSKSG